MKPDYSLYLIVDEKICSEKNLLLIQKLINAGVTCIQLRIKNSSNEHIQQCGEQLLSLIKPKNIPLIINDHIEVAKKINADGVHIGQSDKSYLETRKYLGSKKIIGLSIENYFQAQTCRDYDVDYFGVGPVYPTLSKPDAAPALGADELKKITRVLPKPVVAIGGIHERNIDFVLHSGVAGVAVISAILSAPHPEQAALKLSQIILNYRGLYESI